MATLFAVKHEKQINNGFTIKNESTNETLNMQQMVHQGLI
jgi:hypothetical protein